MGFLVPEEDHNGFRDHKEIEPDRPVVPNRPVFNVVQVVFDPVRDLVKGVGIATLDRIRIDRPHDVGSIDPVNPVYIDKVEQIHAVGWDRRR